MQEQLGSGVWQSKTEGETADESRIAVGDTIWLKEANLQAKVLSVSEAAQEVEVQAGQARLRLSLDRVEKVTASPDGRVPEFTPVSRGLGSRTVSVELNLRGKRADEIEWVLDSYLNDASLANLSEVRIVHGIGTGTVRDIVRDFLASHPLVKSFRPGGQGEGGDGVTIVRL